MVLVIAGLLTVASALAELFAPPWFFDNIGPYPPYNRHYLGDLGAFVLPLGIGLLIAARDPIRHVALIALAAIGNLVHAANHAFDALVQSAQLPRAAGDAASLALVGLILAGVALVVVRRSAT